jgi:NAD(P)H dehydrogenase (quinone)
MSQTILIVFDGKSEGMTDRMARVVATGVRETGLEAVVETVENATVDDLERYPGLILGSPCYFGGVTARMKAFLDATWGRLGRLSGKVGGAFTASAHIGGGNELTLRALHDFFLIHGMIVQGDAKGDPFGPVLINPSGDPGDAVVDDSGECHRLGRRVAELAQRLHGDAPGA